MPSLTSVFFWELAEHGYNRSASKCKEKFENIYKYHKRTKGRAANPDSKPYHFADQIEALESHPSHVPLPSEKLELALVAPTDPSDISQNSANPSSVQHIDTPDFISGSTSSQSLSGEKYAKRKRQWDTIFDKLMGVVVKKQEILQDKFFRKLDQLDRQHAEHEATWTVQEAERLHREEEILLHDRMVAASQNAAVVISLLEKIAEQPKVVCLNNEEMRNTQNFIVGSSRWPRDEVQALVTIRSSLEEVYRGNTNKGSIWEEVSVTMKRFGWNRSAKRCKEKWENMNKYFKRVKGSNKKRSENSKTCPYFHQLEAIYNDKMGKIHESVNPSYGLNAEDLLMPKNRSPKQPPQLLQQEQMSLSAAIDDIGSKNDDLYIEEADGDQDMYIEVADGDMYIVEADGDIQDGEFAGGADRDVSNNPLPMAIDK